MEGEQICADYLYSRMGSGFEMHCTNFHFSRNWLLGVLPLVIDRETTLAEKCVDCLEEVILHNVVPFHR